MAKNEPVKMNIRLRLPGNDFPYSNVKILEGAIDRMAEEKLRFETVSKAGIKRIITRYPDGTIIEEEELATDNAQ